LAAFDTDLVSAARHRSDVELIDLDRLYRGSSVASRPVEPRSRHLSDEDERTRMRVSKAIHRTIKRLTEADAALGRAFQTRIRAGYHCRYVDDPGHPIRWTVRTDGSEFPG
jgi:hypothetical protein